MTATPPRQSAAHIGFLDGFRGMMALWVLLYHLQLDATGQIFGIGRYSFPGYYAVDLFMLLSGFLMQYQWTLKDRSDEPFHVSAADFYVRRFFRIAPVYFLLLIVSFAFYAHYTAWREAVQAAYPPPWSAEASKVVDPTMRGFSWPNLLAHVTFTFGLIPAYCSNNALPDWSIGLEMQFYAAFPVLVWIARKFSFAALTLLGLAAVIVAEHFVGAKLDLAHAIVFPQPSFLPFKIDIFIGGMLLAEASRDRQKAPYLLILAAASLYRSLHLPFALGVLAFSLLVLATTTGHPRIDPIGNWARGVLGSRVGRFFGDTSYGVYLVHTLILFPLMAWLIRQNAFLSLRPSVRCFAVAAATLPVIYGCAYALHRVVELPGIQLGKTVLARIFPKPA